MPRLAAFDIDGTLIGRSGVPTPSDGRCAGRTGRRGGHDRDRDRPSLAPGRAAGAARSRDVVRRLPQRRSGDGRPGSRAGGRSFHDPFTEAIEAAEIARKLLPEVRFGLDMADGRHLWEHNFVPDMPAGLAADLRIDRVDDAIAAVDGAVLTWLVETPGTEMMTAVGELAPGDAAGHRRSDRRASTSPRLPPPE